MNISKSNEHYQGSYFPAHVVFALMKYNSNSNCYSASNKNICRNCIRTNYKSLLVRFNNVAFDFLFLQTEILCQKTILPCSNMEIMCLKVFVGLFLFDNAYIKTLISRRCSRIFLRIPHYFILECPISYLE